ncbi:MAG: hypothetical protein ABH919_01505 [bacterium]
MDFNEIKNILNSGENKIVVIENGKPVMVIIKFNDYKKKFGNQEPEKKEEEDNNLPEELAEEPLKLDDLPF